MKRMFTWGAALLITGGLALPAAGADVDRPTVRKIAVVEKIFDTMLIDSKYALVSSGTNTVGVHLPGYGALFTLEFSFVENKHRKLLDNLEDLEGIVENWRELLQMNDEERAVANEKRRVLFDHVIEELSHALIDYGNTLSFLDEGESVSIAAFPWGETWEVTPEPVTSLIISVKSADLKQYNQGAISEEEILKRLAVREEPE